MMGSTRFHELIQDIGAIHEVKSHDYGNEDPFANIRASVELGISPYKGVLIRMTDKWRRLVNLSKQEAAVKDESIADTLMDLASYAIIALIMWEEEQESDA